jgi:hypothetical protein
MTHVDPYGVLIGTEQMERCRVDVCPDFFRPKGYRCLTMETLWLDHSPAVLRK